MVRGRPKNVERQSFRLDTAVVEKLNAYCEANGTTKTFVVERAIEAYLAGKMPDGKLGA